MPAYCLFLVKSVHDRTKLVEYWATAKSSFAGYNVKMLSAYKDFEIVEGDEEFQAVVIAEFDTYENAKTWYNSAAYAPFKKLRHEGANFLTIFVDGGGNVPVEQRLLPVSGK
ncbi:hypothetical protein GCM10010909_03530 [Acidocella aquatica]|uniref:DUF1330 domain-containing protein n=1 Tax=Acidocella aquatica TaxID=1922313 RepID=A0ABQ6A6F3_9PROT|nr:DUF1330 domain-containing protein [Acidocella aquatica]GLR65675.1 hypothetical protein GCM10010909_03530 [Acidocella aquatica]